MHKYYNNDWLEFEPFNFYEEDSVFIKNIRMRITKSSTDSFQVFLVRMANGDSKVGAERLAERIKFNILQNDTVLSLDKGIAITRQDKFRNQQVIVTVAVPVGKRIYIHENVSWENDVRLPFGRDNNSWDWQNGMESESESLRWRHNVEYVMTEKGLERVDRQMNEDEDQDDNSDEVIEEFRKSREQIEREKQQKLKELEEIDRELQKATDSTVDSTRYRYQTPAPGNPVIPKKPERKNRITTDKNIGTVPTGINDLLMIKFSL
jgi:hypothetical protein